MHLSRIISSWLPISVLLLIFSAGNAQAQKVGVFQRASPPATLTQNIGTVTVTIHYSQPGVKGRTVWGDLIPYGKVWRTGANEATTFEIDGDLLINGQKLSAGKYALFSIPGKEEWTFIFNRNHDQWGAFGYDSDLDALRVKAKAKTNQPFTERLTITINSLETHKGSLKLVWEKLAVAITLSQAQPTSNP